MIHRFKTEAGINLGTTLKGKKNIKTKRAKIYIIKL